MEEIKNANANWSQTILLMHPHRHRAGIATILCSTGRLLASLFGAVAPRAAVATQLPADGGLVPVQKFGNLRLILSGLHERVNLISFSLAEVFEGHKQLRMTGQEALNTKHPEPPNN
jgi:hypothetical protein